MSKFKLDIDGNIAQLTITSPPANALSSTLVAELSEQLDVIESNPAIKAVVLSGEGRFFSAGADIKEFTSLKNEEECEALTRNGQLVFERLEKFPIPVIAAIHGAALGGGLELAMACHMRIVAENAKLGLPELNLGIIPGFAGTQRLPQYVGTSKAYEMILTSEPISGKEAAEIGLANHAVSEEELLSFATKLATKIATRSKGTINRIMELVPYAKYNNYSDGVKREAQAFGEVFMMDDAKEGVQAFIEKRPANFQDK